MKIQFDNKITLACINHPERAATDKVPNGNSGFTYLCWECAQDWNKNFADDDDEKSQSI